MQNGHCRMSPFAGMHTERSFRRERCCIAAMFLLSRERQCSQRATMSAMTTLETDKERFWGKVDRTGGLDACWPWMASRSKYGPGMFKLNGKSVHARRLAYEWEYGPIQKGWEIRASRDCEFACVNPSHLVPMTEFDSRSLNKKDQRPTEERFWEKVDRTGGTEACWIWIAGQNKYGTGTFRLYGKSVPARRLAYEWVCGPIPEGLEIRAGQDCKPACVNPAHLVALPKIESSRRNGKHQLSHCRKGHAFTEENIDWSDGSRNCATCRIGNYERQVARLLVEQDGPDRDSDDTLPDREPVHPELWGDRQRVIGGRMVDAKFERRFWRKADRAGGPETCWKWTGMSDPDGYGLFDIFGSKYSKKRTQAHRVAYELEIGPIPEGQVIDHFRCGKKPCCNPAHLEPVTPSENTRRARRRKPYCQRGHPLSQENSYFTPKGIRSCKACRMLAKIEMLKRGRDGKPSLEEKFWRNVDQSGGPNAHWPWRGRTTDPAGYGMYNTRRAHRMAWELTNGQPIPEGRTIDHKCREKLCCNPDHLEPTSAEENSRRAAPFRPPRRQSAEDRFWARADTSGGPEACWTWPGESMTIWDSENKKSVLVHHFIYRLKVGAVLPGRNITRRCENPECVNYRHLALVRGDREAISVEGSEGTGQLALETG